VRFPYEIVIGEDCSTDATRTIVIRLREQFRDKIRLFLPEHNLGSYGNIIFARILEIAQGQYAAMLDGDDYWTDPYKLQKQVDFLDAHPECVICFHDAVVIYEDGQRESHPYNRTKPKSISNIEDLLIKNYMPTCSVMFRQGSVDKFPDWFYTVEQQDWLLQILNARHGNLGYIDEVMGVYRIHSGGTWSQATPRQYLPSCITMLEAVNEYFDFKYDRTIRSSVSEKYYELAKYYLHQNNLMFARLYAIKSLKEYPLNERVPRGRLLSMLLRAHVPLLHKVSKTLRRFIS